MIPLSLEDIATVVGGAVVGDHPVTVTAPAVLDGRLSQPGGLFVAFDGEQVDGHEFADQAARAGAVAVLGTRPTTLPTVVTADTKRALQALAVHVVARLRGQLDVIGVTGSQGKTSTKDLLAAALSAAAPTIATFGNLNNELGVPVSMLRVENNTRFLALEMGARRVGDITELTGLVAPDVSVVLNVGQAHLGEFGSRAAIARGKGELVQGLAPGGTAILNADDHRVASMRSLTDGPVLTFGRTEQADVRVMGLTLDRLGRPSFTLQVSDAVVPVALPLVGAHQALNAAAAAAAALAVGIPLEVSARGFGSVSLSKWRMEVGDLEGGAMLLNDSYNASPDANRAALDTLASVDARRRIAVLGEMLGLGDDSPAEHHAIGAYAASRADVVVSVGTTAQSIAAGAGASAVALANNDAAIDWLRGNLRAEDAVLLKASRGARFDEIASALA